MIKFDCKLSAKNSGSFEILFNMGDRYWPKAVFVRVVSIDPKQALFTS